MPDEDNQRLAREWLDFEFMEKVAKLGVKHWEKKKSANPFGEQVATMCAFLVWMVSNCGLDPKQKLQVMMDVVSFIRELHNNGWERPTTSRKRRPN